MISTGGGFGLKQEAVELGHQQSLRRRLQQKSASPLKADMRAIASMRPLCAITSCEQLQ